MKTNLELYQKKNMYYQNYQEHPGTRGMTELAAGIGAAAFMLIFMVMIFNAAREKPSQQTPAEPRIDTGNQDEQPTD